MSDDAMNAMNKALAEAINALGKSEKFKVTDAVADEVGAPPPFGSRPPARGLDGGRSDDLTEIAQGAMALTESAPPPRPRPTQRRR